MDYNQIRIAASSLETRENLLDILNRIKIDKYGEKAHPFTIKQLNYFCNPNKCHGTFRTFSIPKKSGKLRTISAPTKIHKSLLVCVNVLLQALYIPNDYAMGFVPGRSVVDNARLHVGHNYILNIDLQDFFPSIPQARVWGAIKVAPFNFNETIASSIAGLCAMRTDGTVDESGKLRYRYVLPQGSPASPIITNIICQKLDRRLAGLARRYGLTYSRYADDITFSSNHSVYSRDGEFMKELERIVTEQNFAINSEKTRLLKKGTRQEVTGLVVSDKVNVVRKYTRDLGSLLHIWERYGYGAASVAFMKNYSGRTQGTPMMERVIEGKLLYLKMVKGEYSQVWQKLQSRFAIQLSRRKNAEGEGAVSTLFSKKISIFECQSGRIVDFRMKRQPAEGAPKVYAVIRPVAEGGKEEFVSLTAACQQMVEKAFAAQESSTFEKLKEQMYISLCTGDNGRFWRIMKCHPAVITGKNQDVTEVDVPADDAFEADYGYIPDDLIAEIAAMEGQDDAFADFDDIPEDLAAEIDAAEEQENIGEDEPLSTSKVLEELAKTHDLKALEKWNTTNNT